MDEINSIELYYGSDSDNKSNIVEIKDINFVETENNIQEINLCEIDTTLDSNSYNNQHLEFKTINNNKQKNYDESYYNNNTKRKK